jgi:two-component system, cell cycle response regulator
VFERPVNAEELAAKIEANVRLKRAIEKLALEQGDQRGSLLRDEGTGMFNRSFFLEAVASEARRCERYGGTFSVLLCRFEGLSRMRKVLGREQVERFLARMAAQLSEVKREADVLARVADGEFAVLLTQCPTEHAAQLVARAHGRIEAARTASSQRWGFGLGVSSFPDVVGTPLQLLAAAAADLRRSRMSASQFSSSAWSGMAWRGSRREERDV